MTELFTKKIFKKDKLARFHKLSSEIYYESMDNSEQFDHIKNISWLYYSRSKQFLRGTQYKVLNTNLKEGPIYLDEIDDGKFEDFNRLLIYFHKNYDLIFLKIKKTKKI